MGTSRPLRLSSVLAAGLLAVTSSGCDRRIGADVAPASSSGPRIELVTSGSQGHVFEVAGLSAEQLSAIKTVDAAGGAAAFEVFVATGGPDAPAMLGATRVEDARLRFTPRYPLTAGVRYRAVLHAARLSPADGADVVAEFEIPRPSPAHVTRVEHIYPTSDSLPENQLKFYIHFSAPMARGEAYRRIHLLGPDGQPIEAPFLELGEELWDPAMRRFTLLCDPGRVKRELKPREELGPVLEAGKHYTLVVDRDWSDADGNPLDKPASKSFEVRAPDETPIDPAVWKIESPAQGTRDELVVTFPESLDHSLMERMLYVVGPSGDRVEGTIHIDEHETRWRFMPASPWRAGSYQLVADVDLEDLAGNAIGRAFDADVFGEVGKSIESKTVTIPLAIQPAAAP